LLLNLMGLQSVSFPRRDHFFVISNDVNTIPLRTRSGDQRLRSHRVTEAGISSDLLPEMQARSRSSDAARLSPDKKPYEDFITETLLLVGSCHSSTQASSRALCKE
jgi:hypothetical protein